MVTLSDLYPLFSGITGAIIGAVVSYYATMSAASKSEKAESERWYSAFFLQKKIDRLADLQTALAACQFETQIYLNAPADQGKEDLRLALKDLRRTLDTATMYLTNDQWKVVNNARAVFEGLVTKKYTNSASLTSKDWDNFEQSAKDAMTMLQELLTPNEVRSSASNVQTIDSRRELGRQRSKKIIVLTEIIGGIFFVVMGGLFAYEAIRVESSAVLEQYFGQFFLSTSFAVGALGLTLLLDGSWKLLTEKVFKRFS